MGLDIRRPGGSGVGKASDGERQAPKQKIGIANA